MEDSRIDDLIEQVRSLTIQVESLKQELRRRGSSPPPLSTTLSAEIGTTDSSFKVGDRVRILNRFNKTVAWNNNRRWSEAEAKTATVTQVRTEQIFFVTDNGVKTWRAPNNLRKLE